MPLDPDAVSRGIKRYNASAKMAVDGPETFWTWKNLENMMMKIKMMDLVQKPAFDQCFRTFVGMTFQTPGSDIHP